MSFKSNTFKKFLKIIKREIPYKGGIEHIQPNNISGWVFLDNHKLDEVYLLYGNHLISKAKIDTYRNDIAEIYDFHGCSGFSISIPEELPIFTKKLVPKIVVFDDKKNIRFEIKSLNKPQKTKDITRALLNSKFRGFIGKFEGLDNNGNLKIVLEVASHIEGIKIWMHSNKFEPLPISIYSEEDNINNTSENLKKLIFIINSYDIPLKNEDKKIWFSYDREGIFIIPKDLTKFLEPNTQSIKLDSETNKEIDKTLQAKTKITLLKEKDLIENLNHIPLDLREDFIMVDNCKKLLDTIENKLHERKNKSFFKKFIQILNK